MEKAPEHARPIRWWLCLFVPLIFSLIPFRAALQNGTVAGAGPDVVTTLWTMAWYRENWMGAAWGGFSDWFNFPFGGHGAILSPMTASLWSILASIMGEAMATTWTGIALLWSMFGALFWMSRQAGWSWLASACAALAVLVPRYPIYTLGETGVVGIAALPMIIGMGIALRLKHVQSWLWIAALGLAMALQGLENPYLTPVLPLFVMMLIIQKQGAKALSTALGIGLIGIVLVGVIHHGATAQDYESVKPNTFIEFLGFYFPVIERPWARVLPFEWIWPDRVLWSYGVMDSIHTGGRGYMGLSLWCACVGGLILSVRRLWIWILLFFLGLILATGSEWGTLPSVFGLLNSIAERLVRALTQPSRYLICAVAGAAGLLGALAHQLERRRPSLAWALWVGLLLDGLFFGGLSLRLPDTKLPDGRCMEGVTEVSGGVLIWPWDGADDENSRATLQSRLFQVVHRHPGATIGTGSWPLVGTVFPGHVLRELGWSKAMTEQGTLDIQKLSDWGYDAVILDHTALRTYDKRGRDKVFADLEVLSSEDACTVLRLPPPSPSAGKPVHPGTAVDTRIRPDNHR